MNSSLNADLSCSRPVMAGGESLRERISAVLLRSAPQVGRPSAGAVGSRAGGSGAGRRAYIVRETVGGVVRQSVQWMGPSRA